MEDLNKALEVISKELVFIYDNEESFLERFHRYKPHEDNIDEMNGIKFEPTKVHFHVNSFLCDMDIVISMHDYLQWKEITQCGR